jgi:hypothetical protein
MPGLSLGIPRGEYPQRIVPAFAVGMATAFAGDAKYALCGKGEGLDYNQPRRHNPEIMIIIGSADILS